MNKTISILGCGWFGLPLSQELVKQGYQVKGSTTTESKLAKLKHLGVEPYKIEFAPQLKGENIDNFLLTPTLIVNIPPQVRKYKEDFHKQQIKNIFSAIASSPIKNVLFISSISCYGGNQGAVDEETVCVPDTSSGKVLLEIESYLKEQSKFKVTVLRLGGLIGPGRHPVKYLAGKRELSRANAPINLLHRQDAISIARKILQQEIWGQLFNVVADDHTTRCVYYSQMARVFAFEPPLFATEKSTQNYKVVSNNKVKQLLDYSFEYPMMSPQIGNFCFVITDKLAGMAYPYSLQVFKELKGLGIQSIVSLSERLPDAKNLAMFAHRHYPLPDFTLIPSEKIHPIIEYIQRAPTPLVVHCEGGIGRTGVVLACVFVAMGSCAQKAIEKVREKRPGAIDDKALENSVHAYSHFLKG